MGNNPLEIATYLFEFTCEFREILNNQCRIISANSVREFTFDDWQVNWPLNICSTHFCPAFLAMLQKLQNRAARILTFSSYDANADPLLDKLSWRKLADRRHFHIATMVYKSLNNLAPEYLRVKFVDRDNVTSYSLIDTTNKLAVPKPHTDYLKKSFSYSGATLWNSLPKEHRQAKSLEVFKSGCKKFFNS